MAPPENPGSPAVPAADRAGIDFQALCNSAPVLIWTSGLDAKCDWFNTPWLEFTGRTLEQEVGDGWAEGVHPEDLDRCVSTYLEAFSRRQEFRMEYRLRRADGAWRWIEDRGLPRFEADGTFLGFIGACTDIQERVEANRQIAEREKDLQVREQVAEASLGVFGFEEGLDRLLGRVIELTPTIASLEFRLHDPRRRLLRVRQCLRGEEKGTWWEAPPEESSGERTLRADQDRVPRLPAADPGGAPLSPIAVPLTAGRHRLGWLVAHPTGPSDATDVERLLLALAPHLALLVEHQSAIAALHDAEVRFADLLANIDEAFWIVSSETGEALHVNAAFARIWGRPVEELREHPSAWFDAILPEDQARIAQQVLTGPVVPSRSRYRIQRPDGGVRTIEARSFPAGRAGEVAHICADVTKREVADSDRRRLFEAISQADEACFLTDLDAIIEWANPAACRITGYSTHELIGRPMSLLKSGRHPETFYRSVRERLRRAESFRETFQDRRKDGTVFSAAVTISPVRDQEGRPFGFVGVMRDVTEQERLEEELSRARELELLGRLVGGVAHEVRNPLHAIEGLISAIEVDVSGNTELQEIVDAIRTQVDRMSRLMNDLLTLGRPTTPSRMSLRDFGAIVGEGIGLWAASNAPRKGDVNVEPGARGTVSADPGRIHQVVINLLDNAAQHSTPGTPITVRVGVEVGEAVLRVVDAGSGIPPERLGDVMKPFFTTRRGGTGLGLTLIGRIVEEQGGRFLLRNNAGGPGCTAEVRLPLISSVRRPA